MIRHYLLFTLMLMLASSSYAKQLDAKQAKEIAQIFLQQKATTRAAVPSPKLAYTAVENPSCVAQSSNLFYVFNRGNFGGFVVIAGDDRMRPVLGYTDKGDFDINTKNDGLQWWLAAITAKAKAVGSGQDSCNNSCAATRVLGSSVEPLVRTKWDQGTPYKDQCPVDNTDGKGERSLTGCVATAMAQILYHCYAPYTQTLSGTVTCHTGAHASTTTDIDLSQFVIDYSKMELTYDGDESEEAKSEVAKLMYACGLSVNTWYCTVASSSNPNPYAFISNFGIDLKCRTAYRSQYTSDGWCRFICNELNSGCPVLYSGQSSYSGHAFICDGYNADGLFHINWGWGGYEDGYFDIYSIDFEYDDNQEVVYGIKPATSTQEIDLDKLLSCKSVNASLSDNGSKISLSYKGLTCSGAKYSGTAGFALCEGDEIKYTFAFNVGFSVGDGTYSYGSWTLNMPTSLADGIYTVRLLAGKSKDTWGLIDTTGDKAYTTITISDGKANADGSTVPLLSLESYSIGNDGCGYVNQETPLTLVIKNTGGEFYGSISSTSSYMSTVKALIPVGETREIVTSVKPTTEGTLSLSITATDDAIGEAVTIGTATVAVKSENERAPKLVVESAKMKNDEIYYGQTATLVVKLHNDGCDFDGKIWVMSDTHVMACDIPSDTVRLSLKSGESTTVEISIDYLGSFDLANKTEGNVDILSLIANYKIDEQNYSDTVKAFAGDEAISFKVSPQGTNPKISVEKIWMEKSAIEYGDKATLHITVKNTGDDFGNFMVLTWVGRSNGISFQQQVPFTLKNGESKTLDVDVDYIATYEKAGVESGLCELTHILCFFGTPPTRNENIEFDDISFYIGKQQQTIIWEQTFNNLCDGDRIELKATASSGLPVEYVITQGSDLAEIKDGILVCKKSGEVVIEARQQGDDTFAPAESVSSTVRILESMTGINSPLIDVMEVFVNNGVVNIVGTTVGQDILIYDSLGVMVDNTIAASESTTITGLQKGHTYIIKVGNYRLKVVM